MSKPRSGAGTNFLWLATAAALAAILAGLYTRLAIQKSAADCIANISPSCGEFTPWMWIAIALLATSGGYLAIYLLRKRIESRWPSGLLAAVFVITLGSAAFHAIRAIGPQHAALLAKIPSIGVSADPSGFKERVRRISASKTHPPSPSADTHPFPEVPRSRSGLAFEGDPFIAKSKAEQAWLDRNGYPNKEQWAAYINASDLRLREAAELGDKAASGVLLHRRLMGGDDSAIDAMLTEGALGSGFALDMLASFLASSRGGEDRMIAYAISRVSEMRGNLRLSGARDLMFDKPLSSVERIQAEQEAVEIYNSIYRLQKNLKGPDSSPVDPRPIDG